MNIISRSYNAFKNYSRFNLFRAYLIAHKQKANIIFIWIPKTAGTSLQKAIQASKLNSLHNIKYKFCERGVVTFGHISYSQLLMYGYVSRDFDYKAYKFAIVRNPYDRAVSLYLYLKDKVRLIPAEQSFLSFLRSLYAKGFEPIGLYNVLGLSQCNPQVRWLDGFYLNYVGRFENLKRDIEPIRIKLGLEKLSISHLNKSNNDGWKKYYCRECLQLVEYLYKEDFEAFSYPLLN